MSYALEWILGLWVVVLPVPVQKMMLLILLSLLRNFGVQHAGGQYVWEKSQCGPYKTITAAIQVISELVVISDLGAFG